jgi:hypothetical protein
MLVTWNDFVGVGVTVGVEDAWYHGEQVAGCVVTQFALYTWTEVSSTLEVEPDSF